MNAGALRCWAGLVCLGMAAPLAGAEKAAGPDLNGVWQGYVVNGKGEKPDSGQTHLELTIKDGSITAKRLDAGGESLGEGNYRLTPGRVTLMDAAEARNRSKGKTYQGICSAENDVLKWCVSTPGNRRPQSFETKGQQFLLILKKKP